MAIERYKKQKELKKIESNYHFYICITMASPFITKPDYWSSIKTPVLDALTGNDDTIIDELSAEAVEQMKSFLNARFDVNIIFSQTGAARNQTIVMYCKDLALFHIFSIYNFRSIPEIRKTRYENALKWMQDVNEQRINPEGLPLNTKTFVKTGSNEKRINHQL